jgi:alpha-1,3-rhamnosyl/mannosyltransferase
VLVPRRIVRAARVITCYEFCPRDIERRNGVPPGKVTAIPLAAAGHFHPRPAAETAEVLARYGLQPGYVFALGRLNRRKNLERLLVAYRQLRASGACEAPLVIGGKPDYGVEAVLGRARLTPGESWVRFAGLIPDADLPHFYQGAACFVYPSLFEGFGLPVVEAMACGTPVIASDRSAMPELVDDAGVLVDPEDVDAIAAAMARVLGDRDLARDLARRGLERSRGYSWAQTADRTLAVYRDAVSAG